ncbi:MAG: efflux RND transporter periplasmic adaptor subunit, partial [Lewinella sp.]|nr:efflux RND transporter periplasmic adaptor subunit [Lewinella sp.]
TVMSEVVETLVAPGVELATAVRQPFPRQLIVTGKLEAERSARLSARAAGWLLRAPEEGQTLAAGETVLAVDDAALRLELEQARVALAEASFRKDELLIRLGGEAGVDTSVTAQQSRAADLRSGYLAARQRLEQAAFALEQTVLSAPFAGTMAEVKVKAYQQVGPGEPIGSLIDLNSLEAVFSVVEEEYPQLHPGQRVEVVPLSHPEVVIPAQVRALNPQVNEHGLLRVHAMLTGDYGRWRLTPGMQVEVTVQLPTREWVAVPKSALVTRGERTVVFVYDSLQQAALWRDVEVVGENRGAVALRTGVEANDRVIITGNLTLDHRSPVRVAGVDD